jgi:NACHT domain
MGLTRTGSIRQGLDYQDTYALLKIADWIERQQAFAWMKLEAREAGFLDDVIIADAQGQSITLFQIKYGVHPETPESEWTLSSLLSPVRKNAQPLFKKWFDSWFDMHHRKAFARVSGVLVTNRLASMELRRCIRNGRDGKKRIAPALLAKRFPAKYREALRQAGNKRLLAHFCRSFNFEFEQPDLENAKAQIRARLRQFGVSEEGWTSLREAVRAWATHRDQPRDSGIIKIDDIKLAALWVLPKALKQDFPFPVDFVLSNHTIHRKLLKSARSVPGGIFVVSGGPGSGKSTYLSYLEGALKMKKHVCLRHHYFLKLDDPDRYRRLKPEVARESLLHDLLVAAPDSLGGQQFHNPNPKELGSYIRTAAKYFRERSTNLVLIVDGLDHVLAERETRELHEFLEDLLPVPEGLCLILGTRPLQANQLPVAVRESAPESEWLSMPGLGLDGCRQLLWRHKVELHIRGSEHDLEEMASAFFNRTNGHPLYSRLCLSILIERATLGCLIAGDVETLPVPPFTGEITDTYESVWSHFSSEAKQVAILLAVTGLPLESSHIIQCLSLARQPSTLVLTGLNQIKPVLSEKQGKQVLFHFSFVEYVRLTPEFDALKTGVLESFKEWLLTLAPVGIKWQNLPLVEFQLGNSKVVFDQLSREWVIQSLCDLRPLDQILRQLDLGVHCAMHLENFPRAHCLGMLRQNLGWTAQSDHSALDKLSMVARRASDEAPRLPQPEDIPSISTDGLCEVAREASHQGNRDFLRAVLQELNRRASSVRTYDYSDVWWKDAKALCDACAISKVDVSRVVEWATLFRRNNRSAELFEAYALTLELSGQTTAITHLLLQALSNPEKRRILEAVAYASIAKKDSTALHKFRQFDGLAKGPWSILYLALIGKVGANARMPNSRIFVDPDREYLDGAEEKRFQRRFTGTYLASVALVLAGNSNHVNDWLSDLGHDDWSRTALKTLVRIGMAHGASLSSGQLPLYEVVFEEFEKFQIPVFSEDRAIWGAWKAFRKSAQDVILATSILRHWIGPEGTSQLSLQHIERMQRCDVIGRVQTQEILSASIKPLLEHNALETYLTQEEDHWHETVDSFHERALTFLDLADIAFRQSLSIHGKRLLRKGANNVLGYGYHKDLYLHEVLSSIDACCQAGTTRTMEWIEKIAPIIQSVLDFTDGDETRHVRSDLAELLGRTNKSTLYSYYLNAVDREDFYLAEDIFHEVLSASDFTDSVQFMIGSTATDDESLQTIQQLASDGRAGAADLLSNLLDAYHRIPTSNKVESSASTDASLSSTGLEHLNAIPPDRIREHLQTKPNRFEKQRCLASWLRIWLAKPDRVEAVYKIALEWAQSVGAENVDKEIYDLLEGYAEEVDPLGIERAFEFFCKAHKAAHGWTWYWQEFSKIDQRWQRLQSIYPGRWREFIRKTLSAYDTGFPSSRMLALPIPRGVEFLIRYSSLMNAEELTAAAVSCLTEMMADVHLPAARWVEQTASSYDVLLKRLIWPSPIVRERAAIAFCELIVNEQTSAQVIDYLCARLRSTSLESHAVLILLPIVKAVRKSPAKFTDLADRLRREVARPSLLSHRFVQEIEAVTRLNKRD